MARYTGRGSNNSTYELRVDVWEKSYSTSGNSSVVAYKMTLASTGGYSFAMWGSTIGLTINGKEVYSNYSQRDLNAYSEIELCSGELSVAHNADGSKTIPISAYYAEGYTEYYTPGSISLNGNLTLTKIIRYPDVSLSQVSKSATILKVKASVTNGIVASKYKFVCNNKTIESTKNTAEFTNLVPHTKYKVTCKAYGNGGYGSEASINITTDSQNTISEIGDFTLNGVDMTISGNSADKSTISVKINGNTILTRDNISVGKYHLSLSENEIETIYKLIGGNDSIASIIVIDTNGSKVEYNKDIIITGDVFSCVICVNGVNKKGKVWVGTPSGNKQGIFTIGTTNGNKRGM